MKKSVLALLLIFVASGDVAAMLERPDVARFEKEFAKYRGKERWRTIKKVAGYGLLGAVAIGGGGYLAYKTFWASDASPEVVGSGSDDTEQQEIKLPQWIYRDTRGFFPKFKDALLTTFALTLAGLILDTFYANTIGAGGMLKKFFSNNAKAVADIVPLKIRIINASQRLQSSMRELHQLKNKNWMGEHYIAEIVASQKIFIHTLESICALLLLHANETKKNKEVMLADCRDFITRLFLFCNKVIDALERDLQAEKWDGFGDDTFELVAVLEKVTTGFIGNHSAPQVAS